jgi:GNAT superfamily N-acetyltransferase
VAADVRRRARGPDCGLRERRLEQGSRHRRRVVRDLHPEQWGIGIGRELIEAGEEELRRLGHRAAILWVLDDNPRARRFYEIAGWSVDGTARRIHIFGFDVPEVRYAKRLYAALKARSR